MREISAGVPINEPIAPAVIPVSEKKNENKKNTFYNDGAFFLSAQ